MLDWPNFIFLSFFLMNFSLFLLLEKKIQKVFHVWDSIRICFYDDANIFFWKINWQNNATKQTCQVNIFSSCHFFANYVLFTIFFSNFYYLKCSHLMFYITLRIRKKHTKKLIWKLLTISVNKFYKSLLILWFSFLTIFVNTLFRYSFIFCWIWTCSFKVKTTIDYNFSCCSDNRRDISENNI